VAAAPPAWKDDPTLSIPYCASRRDAGIWRIQRDLEHIERAKRPPWVHPVNVRDSNAISRKPAGSRQSLRLVVFNVGLVFRSRRRAVIKIKSAWTTSFRDSA